MNVPGEPDSKTIDAWLAGELSEDEVIVIERWFDRNPECAMHAEDADLSEWTENDALFEEIIRDGTTVEDAPAIDELIQCITRSPDAPSLPPPAADAWREVVDEPDQSQRERGIIGTLGRYEVIGVIATGGMGIVLRARDPKLKRVAALKILAPDLAVNATARERFLREARAAATLEHENVLPIYGVVDDGIPWFAMRYAAGGTLQDRLDACEELNAEKLQSITRQVASALEAAHSCGIVHRDIKPANLLFDADNEHIWVCDFGIAQSTEDPGLTYPGAIAGTPKFMSPEQAAGEDLDGRSDLFSLGAVIYRCATGDHFLSGTTTASVLNELRSHESPQIQIRREQLPRWFQNLLNQQLSKSPVDRPENATAVVRAIDEEYCPRPKRQYRLMRRAIVAASIILAVVLLIAGLLQVPTVERAANTLLAQRHERAFFIPGRIGAHSSLRTAIASARDGETIRLPGGEPIAVDNLLIREGKSLTLVAADSKNTPNLTTEIAGALGLVTRSPVRIEGINFVVNAKRDSDGIFIVDNCSASLSDCRFVARRDVLNPDEDIKSRAIELRGNATLEISSCDFDLHDTNAITVLGEKGSLTVSDTRISAFHAVDILGTDALIEQVNVSAENVDFSGQRFLQINSGYPLPEVAVEASRCEFTCERPLVWFRANDTRTVRSQMKWVGRENRHRLGNDLLQIGRNSSIHLAIAMDPIEWLGGTDSKGEPFRVEIQKTGEVFSDLAEAVKMAPHDSTLLLSGKVVIKDAGVRTPVGKILNFRKHPEATVLPTIVVGNTRVPALTVSSSATISGIRFTRLDYASDQLPVLGIHAGPDAEVSIENCEFEVIPSLRLTGRDGIGLALVDTGKVTIRRCLFRCRRSIMPSFSKGFTGNSEIHIEDSVFVGLSALYLDSQSDSAKVQCSFSRSVFHCGYLLRMPIESQPIPFRLSVNRSLVDLVDALVFVPDRGIEEVVDRIIWEGRNNYYGGSFKTFKNSRTKVRMSPPLPSYRFSTLTDFDELIDRLPGSEEIEPSRVTIFDRDQLHPPIVPQDLRAALSAEVTSPAIKALENLIE